MSVFSGARLQDVPTLRKVLQPLDDGWFVLRHRGTEHRRSCRKLACCPVDGNAEHFVDSGFSSCRLAHTFGGLVVDAFVSLSSLGSGARFFASQLGCVEPILGGVEMLLGSR